MYGQFLAVHQLRMCLRMYACERFIDACWEIKANQMWLKSFFWHLITFTLMNQQFPLNLFRMETDNYVNNQNA